MRISGAGAKVLGSFRLVFDTTLGCTDEEIGASMAAGTSKSGYLSTGSAGSPCPVRSKASTGLIAINASAWEVRTAVQGLENVVGTVDVQPMSDPVLGNFEWAITFVDMQHEIPPLLPFVSAATFGGVGSGLYAEGLAPAGSDESAFRSFVESADIGVCWNGTVGAALQYDGADTPANVNRRLEVGNVSCVLADSTQGIAPIGYTWFADSDEIASGSRSSNSDNMFGKQLTSLSPGVRYYVRVSAANSRGYSAANLTSPSSALTPVQPPKAPTSAMHSGALPNVAQFGDDSVVVEWAEPADNGGDDLSEFQIEWSSSADFTADAQVQGMMTVPADESVQGDFLADASPSLRAFRRVVSGIVRGVPLYFRINAWNAERGSGPWAPAA